MSLQTRKNLVRSSLLFVGVATAFLCKSAPGQAIDLTIPHLNNANTFTKTNSFPAVGIGTTSPRSPLEVWGTNGQTALFSSTTNPNNIILKGSTGTTGGIGVQTDSHDPFHTATALLSNNLAVTDGFTKYDYSVTGSALVLESNFNVGGGVKQNEFYWQNEGAYRPLQSRWQPAAGIAETAAFGNFVVDGDAVRLARAASVLAQFRESNPGNYTILDLYNTDPISKGAIVIIGGNGNTYDEIGWNVGNDLFANGSQNFFITNRFSYTFPFFIDRSDHVGIGTIVPFARLTVVGKGTDDIFDVNSTTGKRVLTLTGLGNVGIGTTNPSATLEVAPGQTTLADRWSVRSSRRWKTNIQTIQNASDKVHQLRGVTYDWKDGHGPDVGLIAEEVGQVIPEIVTYEANGVDARSVDYQRLVAVLIEAVKEQDKEISELRQKVEALKISRPPEN
jgi:hypothetical protein